jgi:hypothetical protein
LEEIARREEKRGKKTWIEYDRIRIEDKWWRWDEEEEVLRDGRGKEREEGQREGEERKKERGGNKRDSKGRWDRKEEREWKIGFWNVVGLGNKDKEFWRNLRKWDVIMVMETWVREKE